MYDKASLARSGQMDLTVSLGGKKKEKRKNCIYNYYFIVNAISFFKSITVKYFYGNKNDQRRIHQSDSYKTIAVQPVPFKVLRGIPLGVENEVNLSKIKDLK